MPHLHYQEQVAPLGARDLLLAWHDVVCLLCGGRAAVAHLHHKYLRDTMAPKVQCAFMWQCTGGSVGQHTKCHLEGSHCLPA